MMKPVELLYARNVISRVKGVVEQDLEFSILLENLGFEKLVEVHWVGEDGVWRILKACYKYSLGRNCELWRARARFRSSPMLPLPGSVRFALRYRVAGREHWDNNRSSDYVIDSDSGVMIREGISLLNIGFRRELERGRHSYPITVAVHRSLHPGQVSIHWTKDNWKTRNQTSCFLRKDYWHHALRSYATSPNRYGWEIWGSEIGIGDAFRIEYAVSCDTGKKKIWDNNFGNNYLARRKGLKILTLNLHCYQEDRQDDKFNQIARAISDLKIDIVCFQEVGENWNDGRGDWKSNAARIIRDRLKKLHHLSYHIHTDWSHIGFDRYREGTAILSRYKFLARDSGYVSQSHDPYDIHARRVVMAQAHVPYMGLVNIFSAHLSWWSEGFQQQLENLQRWASTRHTGGVAATFLCGDFNVRAGSMGYILVTGAKEYADEFLEATSPDTFENVFRKSSQDWERHFGSDHRIDYIFMKKGSTLKPTSAKTLFTENDYGRVSDHCGYLVEFEPR